MNKYLVLVFIILFLGTCDDGIPDLQTREESQELIDEYLADNNLTALMTASGLNYIITNEGEGTEMPDLTSSIVAHYHGYLTNGEVFDSTRGGNPISGPLTNFITGWKEGFQLFKKNGKGILIIPPHLGYGANQNGPIPANSILIFEIELQDFN